MYDRSGGLSKTAFSKLSGPVHRVRRYRGGKLAYVLNAEGVPCYASTGVGGKIFDYFYYYLSERTTIIAHIAWNSGGGHFTVLKEIDANHRMYFLDPWYDVVEPNRSSLPNYGIAGGTLSGWLTIPHR